MPLAYAGGDADGAVVDAGAGADEPAVGTYVAKYSAALNGVAKPVGRLESVYGSAGVEGSSGGVFSGAGSGGT